MRINIQDQPIWFWPTPLGLKRLKAHTACVADRGELVSMSLAEYCRVFGPCLSPGGDVGCEGSWIFLSRSDAEGGRAEVEAHIALCDSLRANPKTPLDALLVAIERRELKE